MGDFPVAVVRRAGPRDLGFMVPRRRFPRLATNIMPPTPPSTTMEVRVIRRSAFPNARRTLINSTPSEAPARPPKSRVTPIFRSTFPRRKWAATPEDEAATIWHESDAAATVGGIPIIMRMGVRRNPPPTPRRPERKPTKAPAPINRKRLMLIPATGRKTNISFYTSSWVTIGGPTGRFARALDMTRRSDLLQVEGGYPGS